MRWCVFVIAVIINEIHAAFRTDQAYWKELAENELEEALKVKWNLGTARNVIMFVGDGMGPNTVTATRIYKGGETHRLVYEQFPHMGMLKTYSANKMVPDSSCTATAMFCGVKANQETIGVDASVTLKDCEASLKTDARLKSLAALALEAGKSAGFVTTMRVTHATPSPLYAHSASRRWECEARMPAGTEFCKDIARQLVEDWPGRDLQVIMGGGRQALMTNATVTESDPNDSWGCVRSDGKNLIEDYKKDKQKRGFNYHVVSNNKELQDLDVNTTDYLMGIFANGHLSYEHERDKGPEGMPSISDMTEAAIKVLRKNSKGYFLMIEGGNIDMAHHRGIAKKAINESSAMEDAVRLAVGMTNEEDTLIIVTSDHTHTLTINGYPYRGTDIFGIAQKSPHDNVSFTTLSYGTGGPNSLQYFVAEENNETVIRRRDPLLEDTTSFEYEQISAIISDENGHGGGDVAIYALGPYAHLFHNIHEQHYVYHAVTFAAKIGAHSPATASAANVMTVVSLLFISFKSFATV